MMASVYTVYTTLKDLANKDERGFVTPSVFNNFAQLAQMNVFNKLFAKMTNANVVKSRGLDSGREFGSSKQVHEDLSVFTKSSNLTQANGLFTKPDDLARIISMKTTGSFLLGQTTSVPVDLIYDEGKIEYILRSTLSVPTESRPVCLVADNFEVFPTSIKKITVRYYKQPEGIIPSSGARTASLPKFGYTVTSGGKEVYDSTTSIDFEIPEHYTADLVIEIAKMIGVNLKDSDVFQYAQSEQQTKA
jgi:hypothetical protein